MKKVLSVLLAICLMVGMVTVLASADEASAASPVYIKMPFVGGVQKSVTMNQGDADKFFLTNEEGFATEEGASIENYNIQLTYPADSMPIMYLNNASIISPAPGTMQNGGLTIGYDTEGTENDIVNFDFAIYVEADSVIKGDWRSYDGTAANSTHGGSAVIANNTGMLYITGPGLLEVFNNCNACIYKAGEGENAAVYFQDANFKGVKDTQQPKWDSHHVIEAFDTNVIFDNAVADMTNNSNGVVDTVGKNSPETGKIIIKNKSEINGITTSNGVWGSCILNAPEGITIDNSNVFLHGEGESQYAIGKNPIELIGVGAIGGTKEANAKAFKAGRASGYFYFKAGTDVIIETEPAETVPPTTEAPKPTKPTTPAETKPAETKPAESKPAESKPADNEPQETKPAGTTEDGGSMTWLYIVLGVVILAGVAVMVIVIVKRNAAAEEDDEDEEEEEEEDEEEEEETSEDAE